MDQIFLGNRYELHEEIGSGGMAHVFKARDTLLDRIVAIKILKPEYTEDAQFIERFRVEAKAAASLSNSSIVMIYDVGQDDGVYYIIMEYVDGVTLKAYIANAGQIPWKEAVTLAIQMTQAIESAHAKHIIHRDIKPQNILITRDRKIKITDFGIARAASTTTITTVGNAMGSVHYFSPEQAKGALTDEKSDIYSLGITLYEMLTGVVPFDGETPIAVALKHIQEPPADPSYQNPQIPRGLSAVVLKSIAKDKFDRYQYMGEMLADLKKVMKDPSGETLQYASIYKTDQEWADSITNGGGYAAKNGGYAGAGGFVNGGAYARDSEARDARRPTGAYGDRNAYNDRNAYYDRDGYNQANYAPVANGDYNGGDYPDGGGGYSGEEYADEYGGDGYDDNGDGYESEGYPGDAAISEDDMSGGNRRTGRARPAQARSGYKAPVGGSGRGRAGANNPRNMRGGSYNENQRNAKNSGRRNNSGSSRGGGYTGLFVVVMLIAVLAAIGFVIWIMNNLFNVIQPPSGIAHEDDNFTVGNYINRKYVDVYEELKAAGIKAQENRVQNDDFDEGVIVTQSEEEGRILKVGGSTAITFEVSDGAKRFTVPDYREYGSDSRAAEAELRANMLEVTVVDEQNSAVPKGYVVRTDPGAGTQLAPKSKITVYRSLGSEANQTVVPQLIGKTYRDALDLIEDAKLNVGNITPDTTPTNAIVVRQSHSPNSVVDEGVAIDLWFEEPDTTLPSETTTETTPSPSPTPSPEETAENTPTPTPDGTPEASDPNVSPTPGDNATTTGESSQTTTTEPAATTTATTEPPNANAEPVSMTISLNLPPDRSYGDTIKVLVEATPSDTDRTTRLLNRSVKNDDFPKNVDFTIPANGSVVIKVFYDGELMQTKTFHANE